MNRVMRHCFILLVAAALLGGCAKPPYQELDAVEYMVNYARALQAPDYAPTEFGAAEEALNDARASIKETNYKAARASLRFSMQHARRAAVITEELKTKQEEAARLAREAEAARQAEAQKIQAEALQVETTKPQTPKPAQQRKPETPQPATTYRVGDGENLWIISAKPQVYNDGLLWPLLYQANRDQIKDPRQIFPGQMLHIRRDMTAEELEQARQKARESDIFPVPPHAPDKTPRKQ